MSPKLFIRECLCQPGCILVHSMASRSSYALLHGEAKLLCASSE